MSDLKRVKKLKFAVLHYREIDLDSELLAFKRAQLLEEFKRRSSLNYETLYSARIKKKPPRALSLLTRYALAFGCKET